MSNLRARIDHSKDTACFPKRPFRRATGLYRARSIISHHLILKTVLSAPFVGSLLIFGRVFSSVGASDAADSVTVGDPSQPADLPASIQRAYVGGARHIVIQPGVYLLPDAGRAIFTLADWKDATLSATGVTLVAAHPVPHHDVFELRACTGVTLEGAILSQSEQTAYQGRIVNFGQDPNGKSYCDWQADTGYPSPSPQAQKLESGANIVDAKSRLADGFGDFYDVRQEALSDGKYRFHFHDRFLPFHVGDWLIARRGDPPFKIHLIECRDCTIKGVTLLRNGFSPLREEGGGGNHVLGCKWRLGPRPEGATEDPLVSTMADGLHSTDAYPGLDIENCDFEGIFLDDCIAIHGGFGTVQKVEGSVITLHPPNNALAIGEPARISDAKGFFAEATVTERQRGPGQMMTIRLDRPIAIPVNAKISNPQRCGAGYKIIGCRIGDTRSRGILLKADHGLIRDNVFERCGMSAISLGPEFSWNEADYVRDVTIEGNTLRGNGFVGSGAAVLVHGDGAIGNRDIVIKGNRFLDDVHGDIETEWSEGVRIDKNQFAGPAAWPESLERRPVIMLKNSRAVSLLGNVVTNAASYRGLVEANDQVSGLEHNDPYGIKAAAP